METRNIIYVYSSYIEPSSDIILLSLYIIIVKGIKKHDVMCSDLCSDFDDCYMEDVRYLQTIRWSSITECYDIHHDCSYCFVGWTLRQNHYLKMYKL